MARFGMAEFYGYPINDHSQEAWDARDHGHCPFMNANCNKQGSPGVCSLSEAGTLAITCPERFREEELIYRKVSEYAFGTTNSCVALGEVDFLEPLNVSDKAPGKIDNILVHRDGNEITDWAALEIQAVYFSGDSMRAEIDYFQANRTPPQPGSRHPDFRSCGPKRLLPQLEIKVPTLRRWGKKMFVAIDETFFQWMPEMEEANDISNADICWLVFGLDTSSSPYQLFHSRTVFTTLEESRIGLVAARVPPKGDFEDRLSNFITRNNQQTRRKTVWSS